VAKFQKRPLGFLDRIYNFVGGGFSSPGQMDLSAPITPVHDVSRGSQFDYKGNGPLVTDTRAESKPFFLFVQEHVHVGLGIITNDHSVYAGGTSTAWAGAFFTLPDPAVETVWAIGAFTQSDASILVEATVAVDPGLKAGGGSGSQAWMLVHSAAGMTAPMDDGQRLGVNFTILEVPRFGPAPIPLENKVGNQIALMSNASGAGTIDFFLRCIRLPNGVLPPGYE